MTKQMAAIPPLLSYTLSTLPSPLEVSTTTTTTGKIMVAVAANANVLCKEIVVAVPIGDQADELYSATPPPTGAVDSSSWSLAVNLQSGTALGYQNNLNYTTFTLANTTSGYGVSGSFTLTISGNINNLTGPASVNLAERSTTIKNPGSYSIKSKEFPVTKSSPPPFYLGNFVSSLPGTPTIPATEFANGTSFLLSWSSNGTYFKIFEKGNSTAIYSGIATSFQVTGILTDTTFVLVATLGSETLYETLTVTVSNPSFASLTAQSINATQLNVGGNPQNPTLTAEWIGTDKLAVSSLSTLGNTAISGDFWIESGNVGLFGDAVLLASGTSVSGVDVYVYTDGFAVAQIDFPGTSKQMSYAYVFIQTVKNWFKASGGQYNVLGGPNGVFGEVSNSICIPIMGGNTWHYQGYNLAGNDIDSTLNFYWFPLGVTLPGDSSYKIIGNSQLQPPSPHPLPNIKTMVETRKANATSFIAKFETAFNKSITPEERDELADLLLKL
jgi:hypothetical protein